MTEPADPGTLRTEGGRNILRIQRRLAHPPEKVWRALTDPADLVQWFPAEVRLDLRPGGEFFTLMNGPNGEQFGEPGVFLEIVEKERLVFTDAFRPGWQPSDRAFMAAEVLFEDAGAGKTRYTARAMHWSAEARKEHEEMGFHEGWGKAADQLEALARTL